MSHLSMFIAAALLFAAPLAEEPRALSCPAPHGDPATPHQETVAPTTTTETSTTQPAKAETSVLASSKPEVGPAAGSLMLVGGGNLPNELWHTFFALAGGMDAPVVVIPTALEPVPDDPDRVGIRYFREELGATDLTMLHTRDRDEADSEAFIEPLRRARGVWFTGGRQWRIADAYLGTRTERELWALLERGGVIGGTSAGATIQGSYLARGDTRTNTIMMGDHEQGFGFLKNVAVDQHVLARNRHADLLEIVRARPELLGLGIDENTAIVVAGDRFQVVGEHYVVVTDPDAVLDNGSPFYFLGAGDSFDLAARKAYRRDGTPHERIEARQDVTEQKER